MNYENYTKEDWSKLGGYDWNCLLQRHPQFSEHCDWSKLDGMDWNCLLIEQPQFSEHCDWSKLDGYDWSYLLQRQPQFSEHRDWSKLGGWDWGHLLRTQPQFSEHCTTHVFSFGCGYSDRIIFIDKSKPKIIRIGCFSGTKEEAIVAINRDYSGEAAKNYIAKVEECFGKLDLIEKRSR